MAELGIGSALRPAPVATPATERAAPLAPGKDSQSFLETLKNAIGDVNEAQKSADLAARDLAAGRGGSLHGAMIAMEKAELSLRTMVAVRNKVIDAYQEIMRMQV